MVIQGNGNNSSGKSQGARNGANPRRNIRDVSPPANPSNQKDFKSKVDPRRNIRDIGPAATPSNEEDGTEKTSGEAPSRIGGVASTAPQEGNDTKAPRRSRFDPQAAQVSFPSLMLMAALMKDICDSLDFTGVGIVVTTIISVIYGVCAFIWLRRQGRGSNDLRTKIMQRAAKRYAASLIISFIPFVNIVPEASLFVIFTYLDQKEKSSKHTGGMYRALRGRLMGLGKGK